MYELEDKYMKIRQKSIICLLVFMILGGFIFGAGQLEKEPVVLVNSINELALNEPKGPYIVENTDDSITIIDSVGNEVTIKKPVKTMIVDGMGQVFASLKALRAEEMILASSEYVKRNEAFFPVIANLPSIGMDGAIDFEKIISLNPDFICIDPYYNQKYEMIAQEIPVIQLSFESTNSLKILGAILDRDNEAAEFINWIESYTNIVKDRIDALPEEDLRDVFYYYGGEYGMSAPPPYGTFGSSNIAKNDLIKKAGGRSLSRNLPGDWIGVDPEWVIEQNPSMIIRECFIINDHPEMGYGVKDFSGVKMLKENIFSQSAFKYSDAVKNDNVYLIYGDLSNDSWFVSLIYLAKWFHPDLFSDLDPAKMHQEYITRFQRLDFDVSKNGVFAY